jgi:hypothetical protein
VHQTFLRLAGLDPWGAVTPNCACADGRLYVVDGMRLAAIDLNGGNLLWERTWPSVDPAFFRVPRRPHAHGLSVWASEGAVACLLPAEDGLSVVCCDGETGRQLWRTEVATPPPTEWTEAHPAWPAAPTEEITGCLMVGDALVLALARSSRRMMQWPDFPAPPLRSQLDVYAMDRISGAVRATAQHAGVSVPILENRCLGRWLVADRRVLELDAATADVRTVAELPHAPCWPRADGDRLTVAWRNRGGLGAALLDGSSGQISAESQWKRKAAKEIALHRLDDAVALQINTQFIALLGDDLTPRWEVRIKPGGIYGAAARVGGPVFVATAGGGGGLWAFRRQDGVELLETRLGGGAWQPTAVRGTERIAAVCGDGLAVAPASGDSAIEVVELSGARALVDAGEGRVAVLCGEPEPGVHIVYVE